MSIKGHFMNLYFLALSDGNFDEKELEIILEIAQEKGITKEEFHQMIINPTEVSFSVPESFLEKIFLLYDFVRVILADKKVEDSEIQTFFKFCSQFGFDQKVGEELFDWLLELASKGLGLDEVEQEINKLIEK